MSTDPLGAVRAAGYAVTHELGRGMEGVVWALDDGEPPFDPALPFGESLAALVQRRAPLVGPGLAGGVADEMADALRSLTPLPACLVHGDLGPVHVLLEGGRPVGLLDFGYEPEVLVLYRAASGLVTASCLAGHPGRHLDWCLALVDRWACRP